MYNPLDWYWVVGESTTQVWSSARVQYVSVSDAAYVAWLASGFSPSRILNAAELHNVLMASWAPSLMTQGVQISSTETPTLNGTYACDAISQGRISALSTGIAAGKPLPGSGSTFNYPDINYSMHAFTGPNFLNFAAAIEDYIYNFEQNLFGLLNGGSTPLPSNALLIA